MMHSSYVIHLFDHTEHASPFDVNMAADAGFDMVIPYSNVTTDQVHRLVQDTIFSRDKAGIKHTGIFLGGRGVDIALQMMEIAKKAMVPPFEVSILADPSGAFTTAASLVACVEKSLKDKHGIGFEGLKVVVIGGTGPVGITSGVLAALQGANTTLVDHINLERATNIAETYNKQFGTNMVAAVAGTDETKIPLLEDADVIFATAIAGLEVVGQVVLNATKQLKVAADVNAVPPAGIKGIGVTDFGAAMEHAPNSPGAVGIGALTIGNIKYKTQKALLKDLVQLDEPVYYDFRAAFERSRKILKK